MLQIERRVRKYSPKRAYFGSKQANLRKQRTKLGKNTPHSDFLYKNSEYNLKLVLNF